MIAPPPTRRGDVIDTLHGIDVPDPYRWLEDSADPGVTAWVDAQNDRTLALLAARPQRERWLDRIVELMELRLVSAAQLRGDVVVSVERPAGADQAVLTVRRGDAATVLVDPSAAGDRTAAIDWYETSADGSLVAYGTSSGGTERSTLHVVATDGGGHQADEIPDTRACSIAWEGDGSGFFYTRYPAGEEYGRTVWHHRLGADWHDDEQVWADLPTTESWPDVTLSPDDRWLLVHVSVGWSRTDVHLLDREQRRWSVVVSGALAEHRFELAPGGRSLVGVTTLEASSGRVVELPLPAGEATITPPEGWTTIVAARDTVIAGPHVVGDEIWLVASRNGVDSVERRGADGATLGALEGLGLVSVLGLSADRERAEALLLTASFESPPVLRRAAAGTDAVRKQDRGESLAVVPELTVRAVSYPSLDGTEIGMFLVHRTDVVPEPSTPTILNGYGGFAIAESPTWSPEIVAWCGSGGLYAVAQLRGGSEHGEAWHRAGNRANKQHVFDDFAAAGDWLVANGLTSRDRLALVGRSNGGLLVGATLTQRPDLCRAVWCGVPLLDMVRFPQFLIARLWTEEYGDPDEPTELAWLHAYSPYHHVADGSCYPAVLVTCATGDSRVHPCHARKMTAALQHASRCADERPVLLIEERDAGHGVGKPVTLRAAELANALTFLGWQLGWDRAGS